MEESPVRLADAVREAVETVRTLAAGREVTLQLDSKDCDNASVTGDRTRLVQTFVNLLDNAIKFSKPHGVVKIICKPSGDNAIVSIEDAGQGIAPEFLPFVFDRFRQEDGSKTRSHGGLGLGLALVKSFVEAHKGTIEAESGGSGQGSRFTIRLPLQKDAAASTAEQRPASQPAVTRGPAHLMIIEDDPDTLEMLSATLKTKGFRVTAFDSAADTLRNAPQAAVDLIISDIGMPELDGFEMIKQLRALPNYESVPAIALSGYASPKDVKAALASGFDAHVSKPVDPSELTSIVTRLLKKASRSERETPVKT
jgi:CheY-like chemotaxis protein/two-component sensor histidine kinase